jgi:hypothetical protein
MEVQEMDIKNYIVNKGVKNTVIIKCVISEIMTQQYVQPFKSYEDLGNKIDYALEWYSDHIQ